FDVGQGAVATEDRIIAVEGVRGTDEMLAQVEAAGQPTHGAALVKMPKPGQELRVDLPAIGPRTVERAQACGLSGIAIAAGRSLVIERARTIARADELGLFIVGIEDGSPTEGGDADRASFSPAAFRVIGGRR